AVAPPTPVVENVRLVADSLVVAAPVVAGGYVFWADTRAGNSSLYGHEASSNRTLVLAENPGEKGPIAGDGHWVAWGEHALDGSYALRGYDLVAGQPFNVLDNLPGPATFALGGGVLYSSDPRTSPAAYHAPPLAAERTGTA